MYLTQKVYDLKSLILLPFVTIFFFERHCGPFTQLNTTCELASIIIRHLLKPTKIANSFVPG